MTTTDKPAAAAAATSTSEAVSTGLRRRIGALELAELLQMPSPTDEQVEVIEAGPGPAVVIAGAGSGKTETMASRVVWLVANGLVTADTVLGLTFTRKAATELGARIRRRMRAWARHVEPELRAQLLSAEPTVLTYAAYSGRLVADHALRLGLEPSTRLISPAVAWQLGDSAVRRFTGTLSDDIGTPPSVTNYVLQLAGELADHLQTPEEVLAFSADALRHIDSLPPGTTRGSSPYPTALQPLVRSLNHRLELLPLVANFRADKARIGAVDFADQMVWAARLAVVPEVRGIERDRFKAVLLDEYQDTGHAQIALLSGLFDDGHLVMAVGDPFQSIYSWRGASAGNINRFDQTFRQLDGTTARTFTLSTSWRNDRRILLAANEVATELRGVHPLATQLKPGGAAAEGDVVAARSATVEDEAVWVAEQVRRAWDAAALTRPGVERTAGVLVRRRTQIPLLANALRAEGLPVEIVGLGGLLTTPEVADVVATLHVLADYSSGPALLRLLTGSRWSIGPRDLVALSRRARTLANSGGPASASQAVTAEAAAGSTGDAAAGGRQKVRRDPGSIVEALDDLGDVAQYSPVGGPRLQRLSTELRRLRRRLSAPLPDLVAEIERTIGVDIEVAARADRRTTGRVHLDRFLDAAATFAAEADQATLGAFLAYLTAAEEEENGLEAGEIEVEPERVQILTIHGAKGLEWDIVAVPGLVNEVFPSAPRNHDWTRARHLLPFPLRGDFVDLPPLDIYGATSRRELAGWIDATAKSDPPDDLKSRLRKRHLLDERRLAYVAFTRARHTLIASAYLWDETKKPRDVSVFLDALRAHAVVDEWFEPAAAAVNPLTDREETARWPADPLGPRRPAVVEGAQLVRAAMAEAAAGVSEGPAGGRPPTADGLSDGDAETVRTWAHDVRLLLAERAAQRVGPVRDVELPTRLSVSQLVALREDPDELARRLHRPLPAKPAPLARRGTAFHLWLEQRWGGEKLLDLDELPGAGDETARTDESIIALREAFLASEWAERTPHEVEVPFDMVFDGVVVRGRMDAVFADGDGWLVVDWKTGAVPTGVHAQAAAVQLAAYRLAWQRIVSARGTLVPLESVRAAFHYVPANRTVSPADLLDADGLRRLITAPEAADDPTVPTDSSDPMDSIDPTDSSDPTDSGDPSDTVVP